MPTVGTSLISRSLACTRSRKFPGHLSLQAPGTMLAAGFEPERPLPPPHQVPLQCDKTWGKIRSNTSLRGTPPQNGGVPPSTKHFLLPVSGETRLTLLCSFLSLCSLSHCKPLLCSLCSCSRTGLHGPDRLKSRLRGASVCEAGAPPGARAGKADDLHILRAGLPLLEADGALPAVWGLVLVKPGKNNITAAD